MYSQVSSYIQFLVYYHCRQKIQVLLMKHSFQSFKQDGCEAGLARGIIRCLFRANWRERDGLRGIVGIQDRDLVRCLGWKHKGEALLLDSLMLADRYFEEKGALVSR